MTSSKLTFIYQNTWLQPKDKHKIHGLRPSHDKKTVAAILATLSKENPAVNFKDRILCSYKWLDWNVNIDVKTTFCILQLEILLRT
jgi:hypothetical protein